MKDSKKLSFFYNSVKNKKYLSNLKDILEDFKKEILNLYGNKLKKIILYGSYARGEENEDSDIDLAIVIKGEIRPFKELDRMSEITYDIELKYDILLSLYPISEEHYQNLSTPFLLNIRKEGVLI
ncbi:MAG TPA: nucleotidyltransferase domain-containing protein [Candidatus Lokiarchaeia archaeon]